MLAVAMIAGLGLGLAGCLRPAPARPANAPRSQTKPPEAPRRAFATGAVEAEARDPQRRRLWTIRAKSARLDMIDDRQAAGDMTDVSGTIFQNEQSVSQFEAQQGQADQVKQRLSLRGSVKVTSAAQRAELRADEIDWRADLHRLEARGNVRVISLDYEIGPFPVLFATADLRTVATPDRFPKLP